MKIITLSRTRKDTSSRMNTEDGSVSVVKVIFFFLIHSYYTCHFLHSCTHWSIHAWFSTDAPYFDGNKHSHDNDARIKWMLSLVMLPHISSLVAYPLKPSEHHNESCFLQPCEWELVYFSCFYCNGDHYHYTMRSSLDLMYASAALYAGKMVYHLAWCRELGEGYMIALISFRKSWDQKDSIINKLHLTSLARPRVFGLQ